MYFLKVSLWIITLFLIIFIPLVYFLPTTENFKTTETVSFYIAVFFAGWGFADVAIIIEETISKWKKKRR
jgi:hypothetical protein